jgi:phospholipase/carboxylesterase
MHTTADTLRFGRPLSDARAALILIHGRGSSAADIAGLTESLDAPNCAFLAPSADRGSWYPQRFYVPLELNEPSLTQALRTIDALVKEVTTAGIPPNRIGLVGFSQGACLALEHTARAGTRYGFTAALSGALIGPLDTPRPKRDLGRTPILLGCAESDAHIPLEHVEHSAGVLAGMNAEVTKQIYAGSAHTVFPQEIEWLNRQLSELKG